MAKMAPGPSFVLASGSCVDQKVAKKRLAIIAAYLQAVLEESRLRESVDVQTFLDQGWLEAQACSAKASNDVFTWASAMNPAGEEHVVATSAATPDASTGSSIAVYSPACPRSPSDLALPSATVTEESLLPLPRDQIASPTTTLEENVSKAMHFLLFDARFLARLLRPSDFCSLSQTHTGWRAAIEGVRAIALRPNLKISKPAPAPQGLKELPHHLTLACKNIQTIRREKAAGIPCTLTLILYIEKTLMSVCLSSANEVYRTNGIVEDKKGIDFEDRLQLINS